MFPEGVHTKEDGDEQTRHGCPAIATSLFSSLASALTPEGGQPSLHHRPASLTAPWPTRKLWALPQCADCNLACLRDGGRSSGVTPQHCNCWNWACSIRLPTMRADVALLVASAAQLDADLAR